MAVQVALIEPVLEQIIGLHRRHSLALLFLELHWRRVDGEIKVLFLREEGLVSDLVLFSKKEVASGSQVRGIIFRFGYLLVGKTHPSH